MKKFSFFRFCLLFVLFCTSQCKTISVKDLQPQGAFSQKLPHLTPIFNVYPIPIYPQAYFAQVDSATRQPILLPPILDSAEVRGIRNSYFQDRNASELEVYFSRDVQRNMTQNTGANRGFISCTITAFEQPEIYNGALMFLNLMTLGFPSVIGFPYAKSKSEIEVQVSIKNLKNEIIGTYIGYGKDKKATGLYYGYRASQIQRASGLAAYKEAMEDVKKQIAADAGRLNELL
jgi:hypothetical protein